MHWLQDAYTQKLGDEVRDEVERIHTDDHVSYCLPDMKYAGYQFMPCTIHKAYLFYVDNCGIKRKVAEKNIQQIGAKVC